MDKRGLEMAKIPIYKNLSHKRQNRWLRKRLIHVALHTRKMRDAFSQLSPVDESRIRRRVNREVVDGDFLLDSAITRIGLAYKYTCELLGTVCV